MSPTASECVYIDGAYSCNTLDEEAVDMNDVPKRLFFLGDFKESSHRMLGIASEIAQSLHMDCIVSYSVKTNPSASVLASALNGGMGAECISLAELLYAQAAGFSGRLCTLNGPGKWWPWELAARVEEPAVINCDSLSDAAKTLGVIQNRSWKRCVLGFRITPPGIRSRFGISLKDPVEYAGFCRVLQEVPESLSLGLHFHYARSTIGLHTWLNEIDEVSRLAAEAFRYASRVCSHIDFGGGWRSTDLRNMREELLSATERAMAHLCELQTFQVEPGKMLVESAGVLLCRVLGTRGRGQDTDLVVAAGFSDVPDSKIFPHRMMWRKARGGSWNAFGVGAGRVLGRLCMESDVLREGVRIPNELEEGDLVAICDTGAYDTSMSYSFGAGVL